jgi:hypothetical protein
LYLWKNDNSENLLLHHKETQTKGHAMAQMVSHQPVTAEIQFHPRKVHMGFVVDKVVLERVFFQLLQFLCVTIILPMPHTHSFISVTLLYNLSS